MLPGAFLCQEEKCPSGVQPSGLGSLVTGFLAAGMAPWGQPFMIQKAVSDDQWSTRQLSLLVFFFNPRIGFLFLEWLE